MRNMSFFLTTEQFKNGTKNVTRRRGWRNLRPGDRFMAVVKGQGLKPGEQVQRLGACEVVSAERVPLNAITGDDCRREGFPAMTPAEFVAMFCGHMGGDGLQEVTRIEFRRVDPA